MTTMKSRDFFKQAWPAIRLLTPMLTALAVLAGASFAGAQETKTNKTFIDYFMPTPIVGVLATNVWGAATVGPRDAKSGLEDETMKQWNYWDGQIIMAPDGKYDLFASRLGPGART